MLEPEQITLCVLCDKVAIRARHRHSMIGIHENEGLCREAKALAEYVREYGQVEHGKGYEEGREQEAARQRGGA